MNLRDRLLSIVRVVSEFYGVPEEEIMGRQPRVSLPRSVAYHVVLEVRSDLGPSWVARFFGKDRKSIHHGSQSVVSQMKTSPLFASEVGQLIERARAA